MGSIEISVAAATAVVGYDLLQGERGRQMGRVRQLTGIAVAGSAAALDTKLGLYIDDVYIGSYYNTATGAVLLDAHLRPLDRNLVPPNSLLHLIVEDAPTTNPINVTILYA